MTPMEQRLVEHREKMDDIRETARKTSQEITKMAAAQVAIVYPYEHEHFEGIDDTFKPR